MVAHLKGQAEEPIAIVGPRLAERPALGEERGENYISGDCQLPRVLLRWRKPIREPGNVGGRMGRVGDSDCSGKRTCALGQQQDSVLAHHGAGATFRPADRAWRMEWPLGK